jgi:hypothetical protein
MVDQAMNRLYAYDNPEKKALYVACIFSLINGVCFPLSAYWMADMIWDMSDFGSISNHDFHHKIDRLALWYFVLALGALICNAMAKS